MRRFSRLLVLVLLASPGCATDPQPSDAVDATTDTHGAGDAGEVSAPDDAAAEETTADVTAAGEVTPAEVTPAEDTAVEDTAVDPLDPPVDVSLYFWNLWDNALQPDNRAQIVSWAPDVIFLSDAFDEDDFDLLLDEGGYAHGHHTGENFAVASKLALGSVDVIHHDDITKRILHVELAVTDTVTVDVFEIHLKNPSHASKDFETQKVEVARVLDEIGDRTGHTGTVVIGDFNSRSPQDGATEYIHATQAFLDAGYTDAWLLVHPGEFVVTKIARSLEGSRVDYVMVSPDLVDAVIDAGAELGTTYPEHSDHRAVFGTLRFGGGAVR